MKIRSCHCINLRRASHLITEIYNRRLEPAGMTVNQYSILTNLSRMTGCSVTQLAAELELERTTLVRNLKPLLANGWILDTAQAGRRDRSLLVSAEGEKAVQEARAYWQEAQKEVEERIGRETLELFFSAFEGI